MEQDNKPANPRFIPFVTVNLVWTAILLFSFVNNPNIANKLKQLAGVADADTTKILNKPKVDSSLVPTPIVLPDKENSKVLSFEPHYGHLVSKEFPLPVRQWASEDSLKIGELVVGKSYPIKMKSTKPVKLRSDFNAEGFWYMVVVTDKRNILKGWVCIRAFD